MNNRYTEAVVPSTTLVCFSRIKIFPSFRRYFFRSFGPDPYKKRASCFSFLLVVDGQDEGEGEGEPSVNQVLSCGLKKDYFSCIMTRSQQDQQSWVERLDKACARNEGKLRPVHSYTLSSRMIASDQLDQSDQLAKKTHLPPDTRWMVLLLKTDSRSDIPPKSHCRMRWHGAYSALQDRSTAKTLQNRSDHTCRQLGRHRRH